MAARDKAVTATGAPTAAPDSVRSSARVGGNAAKLEQNAERYERLEREYAARGNLYEAGRMRGKAEVNRSIANLFRGVPPTKEISEPRKEN